MSAHTSEMFEKTKKPQRLKPGQLEQSFVHWAEQPMLGLGGALWEEAVLI